MRKKEEDFRAECERLEAEKADTTRRTAEYREQCEKEMAAFERDMAVEKTQKETQMAEVRAEGERLEKEKADMERNMKEKEDEIAKRAEEHRAACDRLESEKK